MNKILTQYQLFSQMQVHKQLAATLSVPLANALFVEREYTSPNKFHLCFGQKQILITLAGWLMLGANRS